MHCLQEDYGLDPIGTEHLAQRTVFEEKGLSLIFERAKEIKGVGYESYMARMPYDGSIDSEVAERYLRTPERDMPERQLDEFMIKIKAKLLEINKNPGAEPDETVLKELRNSVPGVIRIHEMALNETNRKREAFVCIMDIADMLGARWQEMLRWDVWLLFRYLVPG